MNNGKIRLADGDKRLDWTSKILHEIVNNKCYTDDRIMSCYPMIYGEGQMRISNYRECERIELKVISVLKKNQ